MFPTIEHSCITEETPEYLVVSLKIPKNTVAEHLPLLAAIADRVGSPMVTRGPALAKPKKSRVFASLAVLGLLVMPLPFLPQSSFASLASPVEYTEWHMAKPEFRVGQEIDVVVDYHRTRSCLTNFDRWIERDGREGVWDKVYSSRSFGAAAPNDGFEPLHIILRDSHLPPGKYIYHGVTHSECGGFSGTSDIMHPPLPFTIIE